MSEPAVSDDVSKIELTYQHTGAKVKAYTMIRRYEKAMTACDGEPVTLIVILALPSNPFGWAVPYVPRRPPIAK